MSQRLAWATDVHLNFLDDEAVERFCTHVRASSPEALLLSGDISEAPHLRRHLDALDAGVGVPIHYVLGNHDYYKGSIEEVRRRVGSAAGTYLPTSDVVRIGEAALTGCDGWGDARLGDPEGTRLMLNDFIHIEELAGKLGVTLRATLRALGDREAEIATARLEEAVAVAEHVVFATHVPPFRGACWHDGAVSNDEWLPYFSCKAVGEVLERVAKAHPKHLFTVLCGHTHSAGEVQVLDNLVVRTGGAVYGKPELVDVLTL